MNQTSIFVRFPLVKPFSRPFLLQLLIFHSLKSKYYRLKFRHTCHLQSHSYSYKKYSYSYKKHFHEQYKIFTKQNPPWCWKFTKFYNVTLMVHSSIRRSMRALCLNWRYFDIVCQLLQSETYSKIKWYMYRLPSFHSLSIRNRLRCTFTTLFAITSIM